MLNRVLNLLIHTAIGGAVTGIVAWQALPNASYELLGKLALSGALTSLLSLLKDKDSPIFKLQNDKPQSFGSALKMLAIIGVVLAASVPVYAQYIAGAGAGLRSDIPHSEAYVEGLKQMGFGNVGIIVEARPIFGKPSVSGRVKYEHPIFHTSRCEVNADGQGGGIVTKDASSGMFTAGGNFGCSPLKSKPDFSVVLFGDAVFLAPANPQSYTLKLGFRYILRPRE